MELIVLFVVRLLILLEFHILEILVASGNVVTVVGSGKGEVMTKTDFFIAIFMSIILISAFIAVDYLEKLDAPIY